MKVKWATIKVRIKDIKLLEFNPRTISPREQKKLTDSILKWDLFDLPVCNSDLTVISGNKRVETLLLLGRGEEEIEVRVASRLLSVKEVKEITLLGNTHNGEWDFAALGEHFTDKKLGFDLFNDFNIALPEIQTEATTNGGNSEHAYNHAGGNKEIDVMQFSPDMSITFTFNEFKYKELLRLLAETNPNRETALLELLGLNGQA